MQLTIITAEMVITARRRSGRDWNGWTTTGLTVLSTTYFIWTITTVIDTITLPPDWYTLFVSAKEHPRVTGILEP